MVKLFFFLIFISVLPAQQKTDPANIFNQAAELYKKGEYNQAKVIFTSLKDEDHQFSVPAEIFLGKIFIQIEDFSSARETFSRLSGSVNDTIYRREILLNNALLLYKDKMYYESAEVLLDLISISENTEYSSYAKNALDTIAIYNLSSSQLNVLNNLGKKEHKPLLLLLLGKSYLAEGNRQEAKNSFLKIIQQYKSSPERKEAEDYFYERKTIKLPVQGDPVIVMLFPVEEGAAGKALNQITQGIKYAVHEFNSGRDDVRIGVVAMEYEEKRLREIRDEIMSLNAKCVIGPVYSQDVRDLLEEFRGIKIPLISPTATDDDLPMINEYFFQANPNFTLRGKAMAQYIYYVENKRKIGVLNAIEGYSPLLAASFTREFRELGGEVVINLTYKSRSGNIDDQVIRIAGIIKDIEGLYLPVADKDDIIFLLTALSKHNIVVPLYGNQDWFLGRGYEQFPGIKNNIVFTSDYFIEYSSFNYSVFNEEFRNVTGYEAERNALYGYDITKYFLNQLTKINAGPEIIAQRMMLGNTVTGFHNNISFDEERVNKYINIIRYRDRVFELIDKFKTGN
jgi:ABC-type branched-subunit amino acid transport system substrate-binding protein